MILLLFLLILLLLLAVLVAVARGSRSNEVPDLAFFGTGEDGELVIGWCDEEGRLYSSRTPGELEELERKVGRSLRSPLCLWEPLSEPTESRLHAVLGWLLAPPFWGAEPTSRSGYQKVNGEWFRLPFRIEGCPGAMVEVDADGRFVDVVSYCSTRLIGEYLSVEEREATEPRP